MSALAATSTTDIFGIADKFTGFFRRFSQTSINDRAVSDGVSHVIAGWSDASTTKPVIRSLARTDAPFPQEPLAAVDHVSRILGIPRERVLAAVGVAPRTYYGWKREGHQPRPQSLGRLWPATEAIHFMARAHPNLAAWFHGSAEARSLFDAGDVSGLVQLELDWARRTYSRVTPASPDFGDSPRSTPSADSGPTPAERPSGSPVRLQIDDAAEVSLTRRSPKRS